MFLEAKIIVLEANICRHLKFLMFYLIFFTTTMTTTTTSTNGIKTNY